MGVFVYPLKSARGIALEEAVLEATGIRWDRRWMVVDGTGRMVTQRTVPRMALVGTALEGGDLVLTAPGQDTLRLPLEPAPPDSARRPVSIWADDVAAVDTGDEAAAWISGHLGSEARIVRMPDDGDRTMESGHAPRDGPVSFVDAYPFLLISAEALDQLNERLDQPLPMDRFRPNLVVRGAGPHAEDGWRRIRIGDVAFDVVKPCARCAVTTTDQQTGERGREPLRTLAEYRERDGKVLFGQNAVHEGVGRIRVGDAVVPLEA